MKPKKQTLETAFEEKINGRSKGHDPFGKRTRYAVVGATAAILAFPSLFNFTKDTVQYAYENGIVPIMNFVLEKNYDFVKEHDPIIEKYVAEYNAKLNPDVPLDSDIVRAMIAKETGSLSERKRAFKYDPMQVANKGDYALDVLVHNEVDKKEFSFLIGDFSKYNDKKHTPRKNKRWDYSESNMDAEASIEMGVAWLFQKAAKYGYVENAVVKKEYVVKSGDTFSKIASKLGMDKEALRKYNKIIEPNKIYIGQKIAYETQGSELKIVGWREWNQAVERYNGGGDAEYTENVNKIYAVIKEQRNQDKAYAINKEKNNQTKILGEIRR